MTEFDQKEFWDGLGRLYTSTVNLVTATEKLRAIAEERAREKEGGL